MAGSLANQFFKYSVIIIVICYFVTSFEYFHDDITKVFKEVVDENPNDI